ncbi:uncharacterized protein LOC131630237 [Vicia villosa]|uniref:uncharacterized protein LOC131630237 n=1 Tax=Vicia villosa TaxID=3911 RepID=UPI00273BCA0D|nr:uncharacterized protein LOC131630237 [Vicia villosa]
MEQIQTDMAEIRAQIGTTMGQFLEAIQTVTRGQEELRQHVQRPDVTVDPSGVHQKVVNPTQEVPLNQNVRNTMRVPVNEAPHRENLSVSSYDTFKFPMDEDEGKLRLLDKRLKAIEDRDCLGLDAASLCLVPDIKIPPKFKAPNFEKYKGTTCPITHIKDSLSGASLEWYTQLERTNIRTWKDLAKAFFKHYKHNSDMVPTRIQLQGLTQKVDESFREYAQRWRELAARVQPPLLERELIDMFMDTLQDPYLNRMVGCAASEFSTLVVIGERIEHGLMTGRIQNTATNFEFPEQDGEETSTISEVEEKDHAYSPVQIPCYQMTEITPDQDAPQICAATISQPPVQFVQQEPVLYNQSVKYAPQQQQRYRQNRRPQGGQNQRRPRKVYEPIPMPHSQLLSHLLRNSLVELKQLGPPPFLYPEGYDPNAYCEFHSGAPGHSIEGCNVFKGTVQNLIDSKAICFTPNGLRIN